MNVIVKRGHAVPGLVVTVRGKTVEIDCGEACCSRASKEKRWPLHASSPKGGWRRRRRPGDRQRRHRRHRREPRNHVVRAERHHRDHGHPRQVRLGLPPSVRGSPRASRIAGTLLQGAGQDDDRRRRVGGDQARQLGAHGKGAHPVVRACDPARESRATRRSPGSRRRATGGSRPRTSAATGGGSGASQAVHVDRRASGGRSRRALPRRTARPPVAAHGALGQDLLGREGEVDRRERLPGTPPLWDHCV